MTSFKEISVEDYKKLLDNRQHTFAKTFKNTELLRNFEQTKNKNTIDDIIKEEENLKKEDNYIEKLSNKISNKLQPELIKDDGKKEYNFLNNANYYIENPRIILSTIKDIYLKSNIPFEDIYTPRSTTKNVYLDSIIRKINSNTDIPDEIKYNFVRDYNNIVNKTSIKYDRESYEKYVLNPIKEYYDQDEERNEKDKSLKDKLKSDIGKTIIRNVVGQSIFDKIKIDKDLLKKNILKVRYKHNDRKLNNKLLKEDYKISNNMKNALLKNININKLTKNEYNVYNALQKYIRNNNDNLQLLISRYLSGNKSKDLYNKINEMLYNNYKNNKISKKEYQNIINILYIMLEPILNSNDHKVDVNKLKHEFKSPVKFNNSYIFLTQAIFYNFFHNVKEDYQMDVKKDNTFYKISFIDSMLEVSDLIKL